MLILTGGSLKYKVRLDLHGILSSSASLTLGLGIVLLTLGLGIVLLTLGLGYRTVNSGAGVSYC